MSAALAFAMLLVGVLGCWRYRATLSRLPGDRVTEPEDPSPMRNFVDRYHEQIARALVVAVVLALGFGAVVKWG